MLSYFKKIMMILSIRIIILSTLTVVLISYPFSPLGRLGKKLNSGIKSKNV